jgi:predicted ATPase
MAAEVERWLKMGIAWTAAPISLYAEALAEMGDVAEALKLLDHAISRGQRDDVHWYEAELHRIKGNLLLIDSTADPSGVEDAYWRAIEVARAQSAKSMELRASMSLALLWQSMDKSEQALELLHPVYDWFTEGLDTRDLIQANALLAELK